MRGQRDGAHRGGAGAGPAGPARGKSSPAVRAAAGGAGGVGPGAVSLVNAALEQAQQALDGLPAEDRRGTAFGYTERQLLFHSGDALVTLGDYRGADDAFGQALRLYAPAEFLDRSLITLGQARCQLSPASRRRPCG